MANPLKQMKQAILVLLLAAPAQADPPTPGKRVAGRTAKPVQHRSPPQQHRPSTVPTWPNREDPQPLVTREYLALTLRLSAGAVAVTGVERRGFPGYKPSRLPRYSGNYSVRLQRDTQLLDVVRFNFPLTGGAVQPGIAAAAWLERELARGVSTSLTVRVPWDSRISRVVVSGPRAAPVTVDISSVLPFGPPQPPALQTTLKKPTRKTKAAKPPGKRRRPRRPAPSR